MADDGGTETHSVDRNPMSLRHTFDRMRKDASRFSKKTGDNTRLASITMIFSLGKISAIFSNFRTVDGTHMRRMSPTITENNFEAHLHVGHTHG